MLHALAAEASPREVWWLHGARSGDEHPFARESLRLVESLAHGRSYIEYSKPGSADRLGIDFDAAGHLDVLLLDKLGVASDADFYLCGPPAFMQEFKSGLKTRGIPPERVHAEVFGPGESRTPGVVDAPPRPPHLPSGLVGSGPRVSFARSGLTVRWDPSFQTLLELAEACDIPVKWSCRTGVCHNCESGLVSGTVDYDPDPLDPPAGGKVLICCSRPREDLVVDL
jgi:ferredoxin-NADP reductase